MGLFLFLVWPMARANIQDMALIRAFGGDETAIVETLSSMLERSSPDPGVYKYGSLYFQVPFGIMKLMSSTDPHYIALIFRIMSVLGGLLALAGLGWFGRALFGPGAGAAAVWLSCALPLLTRWSKTIHPDTLGLAGLVAAWGLVLWALKKERVGPLLWAGVVAGLAAGVKLNSVFLVLFLPLALIGLVRTGRAAGWARPGYALGALAAAIAALAGVGAALAFLATPERLAKAGELVALETGGTEALPFWVNALPLLGWGMAALAVAVLGLAVLAWRLYLFGRLPRLAAFITTLALTGLFFGAGFFVADAAAFFNPGPVAAWFLNETVRLKHSYVPEGLFFFRTMVDMGYWGWLGTGLSALGFLVLALKPRDRADRWVAGLLAGWVIFNLLYLTHSIDAPKPRHAIQILPALIWLAAVGLAWLGGFLGRLLPRPWLGLALAGLLLLPGLKHGTAYGLQLQKDVAAYAASPAVEVGRYLEREFAPGTVILHDPYVYVPVAFTSSREVWEPSLGLLDSYQPDLVIINRGYFRRYVSFDNAAGLMRPQKRQEAADYYRALVEDGASGRFRPLRKFGEITVLARAGFEPERGQKIDGRD